MTGTEFANKKVVVMGLGRFGGAIGAARWLAEAGARVIVTDQAQSEKLADSIVQLQDLALEFRLGGHDERDLDGCDLLVVSPAVPRDRSAFVQQAVARGVPISSEMNLFIERCPARKVVGVTGSAGKSTTTAMIGSILEAAQAAGAVPHAWVGGNIGRSLLGDLAVMSPDDVVALELSSFQLEDLGPLRWSPPVAVITNIQPNHLDRHGTLEAYADAKLNIVRYQKDDDVVFVHPGDEETRRRVEAAGAGPRLRECVFDPVFAEVLRVPGGHNRLNAAAATAVARALGLSDEIITRGLGSFRGLPHRLEFVGEHDGVRWYNDSKSTTPESTRIALEAFEEPVIMLVGGQGKGMPFDAMGRLLAQQAKAVVCYGQAGPQIYLEVMAGRAAGGGAAAERADDLAEATRRARALAVPGDVVVLSPACTSYDGFVNYEQRGETFRRLVAELSQS